eukprot:COSAG01_NODE_806_length_13438_cov_1217.428143_1_plen_62_part_10
MQPKLGESAERGTLAGHSLNGVCTHLDAAVIEASCQASNTLDSFLYVFTAASNACSFSTRSL